MATVLVTSSVSVAQGEVVRVVNETAFWIGGTPDGVPRVLTIAGSIHATYNTEYPSYHFHTPPVVSVLIPILSNGIVVEPTGSITAADALLSRHVTGISNWIGVNVFNHGTIQVSGGEATAIALDAYTTLLNNGVLSVVARTGPGVGVRVGENSAFTNNGKVSVESSAVGSGSAGVHFLSGVGKFLNTGSIVVSGAGAAAIVVDGPLSSTGEFINRGLISGDVSLKLTDYDGIRKGSIATFTNEGTLRGDVRLSSVDNRLVNSGLIDGNVELGAGYDLYDGRAGTLAAGRVVRGGDGGDRILGGAGGELLLGEEGDDDLFGGEGSDTLNGGLGADRIDGEGGLDFVSYEGLTVGISYSALTGQIGGGGGGDTIAGFETLGGGAGNDTLAGGNGDDAFLGSSGDDLITGGASGRNYLWGGDGADYIAGGDQFDNTHGNAGSDTIRGGGGDDWVIGGKDADRLYGEAGADLVYGNMGVDTCYGGAGDDVVLGGQDNDQLFGEEGADTLSGDRGADTISGGAGGDLFQAFEGAGLDRILDFSYAEGDRLRLLGVSTYALAEVNGDTVIRYGAGDEIVLVGVLGAASSWFVAG